MIKRLAKLFCRHKTDRTIPTNPPWAETVMLMRKQSPNAFADTVLKVVYSKDSKHRFILLKSKNGYYYYVVEHLTELDDEEWRYASLFPDALPALWLPAENRFWRSLFGWESEALRDFAASDEYKKYFSDAE